jgi:uncharacterized protein (TIGR03083 family)
MRLSPRYEGSTILSIDDEPTCQLVPVTRQRERFRATLANLTAEQWQQPSRCAGWTVREVVAHLVTVNAFWNASVVAGRNGTPTRMLAGFDPAASPPKLVDTMNALTAAEVFEQFTATNDALLETLRALTDDEWSMPAESPVGHVSIRLVAQHALWDSWIHERDVVLPLELTAAVEHDEAVSCLQYAAVVGPLMSLGVGHAARGTLAIDATDPTVRLVLDVDEQVSLRTLSSIESLPCLNGDAVELVEVLSLRSPAGAAAPREWIEMLAGLQTAFGVDAARG